MGFELIKSSIEKIIHPQEMACDMITVAILVASILVKIYMFSYNRSIGKKIESEVLDANGGITDGALKNRIKLILKFPQYFGHFVPIGSYAVWAVWDGLNEEFFEIESKQYICDEDIAEWWEDNKK